MTPEAICLSLRKLLAEVPPLMGRGDYGEDQHRWLGRAQAIVEQCDDPLDLGRFKGALAFLHAGDKRQSVSTIMQVLHSALARAEMAAPEVAQDVFIPVGADFTAFNAVSQAVREAKSSVLFIDPYLNEVTLRDFATLVPENVEVLLLSDGKYPKLHTALKVGVERWTAQYGKARPVEARIAKPGALHDRAILVDMNTVWLVSQSFKDLANRSPASIAKADAELSDAKVSAYRDIWGQSAGL